MLVQDGYTLEILDVYGLADGKEQAVVSNVSDGSFNECRFY